MAHRTRAALVALTLAAACTRGKEGAAAPEGLGRRVHDGPARALAASPDGERLAFLDGCEEVRNARFLPPRTARCDLQVVPAAGGAERRIARGVTTLPQGISWSPDGKLLAAQADYDYAAASSTLVLWDGGAPRKLAEGVTFLGFGAQGELGFVAGGALSVLLPGAQAPRVLPGAERIASFDVPSGDGGACGERASTATRLVARRVQAAGGELLRAGCALDRLEPLERGEVGDYDFSRDGRALAFTVIGRDGASLRWVPAAERAQPRLAGEGIQSFAFGPTGTDLAYVAGAAPGKQGDLYLGHPGKGASWRSVRLAREAGEFRWAATAPRLAWLERYDPRVRAGSVGAGGDDLPARTLAPRVSEFDLSADGRSVAFLQHTLRGGYSVDLGLARLDPAGAPTTVATGVFGFAFSPDGRWLYYRTRCVRNADACDLERVPAAGLAPGAAPERIASGVKSFDFDPRDPGRLLLGWQRSDLVALDLGVWEAGRLTRVDTAVQPGSAQFLAPDSRRLAYVVVAPKREGVYVADLPR